MNLKNVGGVALSLVAVACLALGGSLNASTLESGGAKVDAAQSETPSTTATAQPETPTPTPTQEFKSASRNSFWAPFLCVLGGCLALSWIVFRAFFERLGVWLFEDGLMKMWKKIAERRERNRQKESPQTSRLQEAKSSPSLENLTQTDFRLWEEIAQSKDQAITIKQLPPLSKAMKALRDAQRLDVPCRFHELTDPEDAVIIDGRQLKYTPVVVDQSLARLCDAGVLKRCEWQGGMRVYPLLVPYDAHAEPSA